MDSTGLGSESLKRGRTPGLSAKGAKCESLGHRPRWDELKIFFSAEGAKCGWPFIITTFSNDSCVFRAFSASKEFMNLYLGRCPRLLHFAPLALRPMSFQTAS